MIAQLNILVIPIFLRQEIDVLGEEPRTSLPPQASQPTAKPTTKSYGSVLTDQSSHDANHSKVSKSKVSKPMASKLIISETTMPAKQQASTIPLSTMRPLHPAPPKSALTKVGYVARRTVALASDIVVLAVFIPIVGVMTVINTVRRWIVRR